MFEGDSALAVLEYVQPKTVQGIYVVCVLVR